MTGVVAGHWLDPQTEEFDLVRFQVISAAQHLGVLVRLEVWKIENPDLLVKYDRRSHGMLKVQTFVPVDSLSADNSVEAVCSRGYHLGYGASAGAMFTSGILHLPNKESTFSRDLQFLFLEIAVGRSYVYDGSLNAATVPAGYDSLYIPEQPLDRNHDGKFSLQEYQSAASFDNRDSRYSAVNINYVTKSH